MTRQHAGGAAPAPAPRRPARAACTGHSPGAPLQLCSQSCGPNQAGNSDSYATQIGISSTEKFHSAALMRIYVMSMPEPAVIFCEPHHASSLDTPSEPTLKGYTTAGAARSFLPRRLPESGHPVAYPRLETGSLIVLRTE